MMEQGSAEWLAARCGKVTASRVADVCARLKTGGWGKSRSDYMAELIAERLTGDAASHYKSAAMQWGTDTEPQARKAYSFRTDNTVTLCGFIDHPSIPFAGASPDGMIGDDGLVEFKCPTTGTHLDTLMGSKIPDGYIVQMQWQMACAGRLWCDYVSFDPRLPEAMRLHVTRVERDTKRIAQLEHDVTEFLEELGARVRVLRSTYEAAA